MIVILYSVILEYKKHVFYIISWKRQLIPSFSMKIIYSFYDCFCFKVPEGDEFWNL